MTAIKRRQLNKLIRYAAVIIVLSAFILLCAVSGSAVDLEREMTLTVSLGESAYLESLRKAELTADLYLLAAASERPGEDAYDFRLLDPFTELELPVDDPEADWQAVAQEAMALAIKEGSPVTSGAPVETVISRTNGGTALSPGLYLMLIRGKDPVDYVEESPDGEGQVTVAYSGADKFLFAPELISLPTRQSSEPGRPNTSGEGEWLYDLTVYPKFERVPRFGQLIIEKTLTSYMADAPACFIFLVEATLDGEVVYSDVLMLDFTGPGTQTVTIDRIPAGAVVVVTEINSGINYTLVSEGVRTVVLTADEPQTVSFENEYSGTPNSGGAIDNYFSYTVEEGWNCQGITPRTGN